MGHEAREGEAPASSDDERTATTSPSIRLLDQVRPFNYVTAPNAPTYRAIMDRSRPWE